MKSITTKALTIIVLPLFISFIIANIVSFFSIYNNTLEATGIEAYGCANITTALIDPDLMNKALQKDQKAIKEIGQSLNWTVDHKHIFRNQYILNLDGKVIVTDDYSSHHGLHVGDKHPINQETIEYIKTHKSPIYSKVYKISRKALSTDLIAVIPFCDCLAVKSIDCTVSSVPTKWYSPVR